MNRTKKIEHLLSRILRIEDFLTKQFRTFTFEDSLIKESIESQEESLPINTDPGKIIESPSEHVHIKTNDSHCEPGTAKNAEWWPDKIICWKCGFNIEITEKPEMYIIYCPECNTINSLNPVSPEDYRKHS